MSSLLVWRLFGVNRREEKNAKEDDIFGKNLQRPIGAVVGGAYESARFPSQFVLHTSEKSHTFLSACSWNAGVWDIVICGLSPRTFGGSCFLLGYWAAQDQPTRNVHSSKKTEKGSGSERSWDILRIIGENMESGPGCCPSPGDKKADYLHLSGLGATWLTTSLENRLLSSSGPYNSLHLMWAWACVLWGGEDHTKRGMTPQPHSDCRAH